MQCIELVREQTKAAIGDRREKANGEREGEREKASGEGEREGERGRHLRSKHGHLPLIAMRREDCFAATSSSGPTVLNKATGSQREEATSGCSKFLPTTKQFFFLPFSIKYITITRL